MYIDSEGIILRQTKTTNGRRMVLLFSKNTVRSAREAVSVKKAGAKRHWR